MPEFTSSHEAMATTFRSTVVASGARYARQAAAAAFEELDVIEAHLSRYVENSDISRINRLSARESTVVALDTFDCLRIALALTRNTGGAFDVTYASAANTRGRAIVLETANRSVRVMGDGVQLDLGGIGKGFGLDRMAAVLREWDVGQALLWASTSTVLAVGRAPEPSGWPVELRATAKPRCITLANEALSASGLAVKADHIVDPQTGRPARQWLRCWAQAPTAAVADALSTAFMVMTEQQIQDYCEKHPPVTAFLQSTESAPLITISASHAADGDTRRYPA